MHDIAIPSSFAVGDAVFHPEFEGGFLKSLGAVEIRGTPVRNSGVRFLPWFDTYEGDVFRSYRFLGIGEKEGCVTLRLEAVSDPDYPFRERRDCSGNICLRDRSWDAKPLTASLEILFEPRDATVDGRRFSGFRYSFSYEGPPIHRLIDRQTWEIGGNLDDVTLCLRNWLMPPRSRITRGGAYSTAGLDKWAALLPGNLWGRWSLLPAFDLQYGSRGVLAGWFEEMSLIRTVVESGPGDDHLRVIDLHLFGQSGAVRTNPKSILFCPDVLDEVDALNLWTRLQDREAEKARGQFGIGRESPPLFGLSENVWKDVRFDSTYEHVIDVAGAFEADFVFIDSIWEHQEALRQELEARVPAERQKGTIFEKWEPQNMCVTLDFEVAGVLGGERGLKALCERAGERGVMVLSWMALHLSPNTRLASDAALGGEGIFACSESGRHPDTGYAKSCWPVNLHAPVGAKIREQLLGVCRRTGLKGYLWDSFCNLGWWQVDYAGGTLRPQFEKVAELYRDFVGEGLYLLPEALVTFSSHSSIGLHGGDVYAGDQLGYSYDTNINLQLDLDNPESEDQAILLGKRPIDLLFQCVAHRRVPVLNLHRVPREKWDARGFEAIRSVIRTYRKCRGLMVRRTVLKDGKGVLWENGTGQGVLFSFLGQDWPGRAVEVESGTEGEGRLEANRVYLVPTGGEAGSG